MSVPPLPPLGTLARSRLLLSAFRSEQTDPTGFYGLLAADSARQVAAFTDLDGAVLLDVGGGPGFFADAFADHGARYVGIDAAVGELSLHGRDIASNVGRQMVLGSGTDLPVGTAAVDVCYSSNVLEHVDQPERMAQEMVRVTRPGGLVFLSYNNWLAPNGGHETAPWHYLGGHRAADRYARKAGHRPKNDFGQTLFALSVARMLRWADGAVAAGTVQQVQRFPRYHPRWAHWVVHVPLVREVATWNLVLVLRRS